MPGNDVETTVPSASPFPDATGARLFPSRRRLKAVISACSAEHEAQAGIQRRDACGNVLLPGSSEALGDTLHIREQRIHLARAIIRRLRQDFARLDIYHPRRDGVRAPHLAH